MRRWLILLSAMAYGQAQLCTPAVPLQAPQRNDIEEEVVVNAYFKLPSRESWVNWMVYQRSRYDEQGRNVESFTRRLDGTEWRWVARYAPQERQEELYLDGELIQRTRAVLDPAGRELERKQFDPQGRETFRKVTRYDPEGRVASFESYEDGQKFGEVACRYRLDPARRRYRTEQLSRTLKDGRWQSDTLVTEVYLDPEGHWVEEERSTAHPFVNHKTYLRPGLLLEWRSFNPALSWLRLTRYTYTFNARGDWTRRVTLREGQEDSLEERILAYR